MTLANIQEWATGGAIATAIALLSFWWNAKKDSKEAKLKAEEAKDQATKVVVDAASAATGIVTRAMEQQAEQITELSARITNLDTRLTTAKELQEVALVHIADREMWTVQRWDKRPDGLPVIPAVLTAEVVKVKPDLADSVHVGTLPQFRPQEE